MLFRSIRMLLVPGKHSVVCFDPCFSIYPIQAQVCGVEVRRQPLNPDFARNAPTAFAIWAAWWKAVPRRLRT